MKTLAYYLLGIFSLCLLNACSDEENPTPEPPPSKGQEEVQKIVEVLKESNPEVSQFVEILEKVNVADLTQDELTVFAVKNKNTASRAAVLDTASIKNHIVKGRYAKEDLTDGSTLTSISNETLYVTRTENDVQINGVKIEGNAIPAGNSYVYVVPEVIPTAEVPLVPLHATTIITKLPTGEALAGVNIEAKDGRGNLLGTFTTNENGEAIIQHQSDTLSYVISKENFSNLHDGFLIAGMDENGNLIYADLNGDGLMDLILLGDGAPTPGGGTIYMNEGDFVFTPVDMETSGFVQVRAVPTGTFADMNHDGKLDAALMGYSNSLGYFSGIIYQGDNNTYNYGGEKEVFNAGERQGGLVIADFSNDGKLDAFGVDGNVSNEVALFKNTSEMVNQAPTAPTNVVAKIEKGMLTVTWDDATDDVTPAEALFYNVYVKNNNTGKISMIIPANPETGRLKVITVYQTGVRSVLKSYSVKVDASEGYSYTVGVQAIDQAQGASTFTTQLLGKDTGIAQSEVANNVRIETVKEGFIVRADSNLDVEVTDMLGRVVAKDKANKVIPVSSNGIYLITTGGRTYKVGK